MTRPPDEMRADAGSYRDPSGRVFVLGDRVLRSVMPRAAADFEFVRSTGVLERLIAEGSAIAEQRVDPSGLPPAFDDARYVVQHPKLPFVSYPYEWCFTALKRAALLHLDIQIRCLEQDVTLSDASAYNIQFLGPKPIFIDSLSFRRYHEGEFWIGHKQFCEQFLNPLLLRALLGVSHNAWYRGGLEGIPTAELSRLLPLRRKLSWNVLTNVVMPASFQRAATGRCGYRHPERPPGCRAPPCSACWSGCASGSRRSSRRIAARPSGATTPITPPTRPTRSSVSGR